MAHVESLYASRRREPRDDLVERDAVVDVEERRRLVQEQQLEHVAGPDRGEIARPIRGGVVGHLQEDLEVGVVRVGRGGHADLQEFEHLERAFRAASDVEEAPAVSTRGMLGEQPRHRRQRHALAGPGMAEEHHRLVRRFERDVEREGAEAATDVDMHAHGSIPGARRTTRRSAISSTSAPFGSSMKTSLS